MGAKSIIQHSFLLTMTKQLKEDVPTCILLTNGAVS
jgi:hypothetical protein